MKHLSAPSGYICVNDTNKERQKMSGEEDGGRGTNIGTCFIGEPTCAEDSLQSGLFSPFCPKCVFFQD